MHLAGAKIHLSQHEDGDVVIEGSSELRPIHQPQRHLVAEKLGQTLRNVKIGPEIFLFRNDDLSSRPELQSRSEQFEDVHRSRIRDRDLNWIRADQTRDRSGHPLRKLDPAMLRPAPDEV